MYVCMYTKTCFCEIIYILRVEVGKYILNTMFISFVRQIPLRVTEGDESCGCGTVERCEKTVKETRL